jgi:uncharacterized protein YjbI with pentapeptide repeats
MLIKNYKIEPFADLREANLRGANLGGANLYGANLYGANLGGAYLGGANLRATNLRGANLYGANLGGANLYSADFGGLIIKQGPVRYDGYQYILFTSVLGGCVIRAGCRTWSGDNAFEQARHHCETATSEKYQAEALRIIDFLEGEFAAISRVSK